MTQPRIYIACTGAGAGAQQEIWKTPGCSSYFAGACFPYGSDQLEEFIGYAPEKSVTPDVAVEMAMMAYYKAYRYGEECVGIGLTAAVATNRSRRGDSVIFGARCDSQGVWLYTVPLRRGEGETIRRNDGRAADAVVSALLNDVTLDNNWTKEAQRLLLDRPYWSYDGKRLPVESFTSQVVQPATDRSSKVCRALYPGAFNPPHPGHFAIAKKTDAVFSLEICPPHKGPIPVHEVLGRLKLLRHHDVLLTSGLPLYLDKSNRFPNHPIVVGSDAFIRMLDPKWGPDPVDILRQMSENETEMWIVGRDVNGKYVSGDDAIAHVPESGTLYGLKPIDIPELPQGLSSTKIREAMRK